MAESWLHEAACIQRPEMWPTEGYMKLCVDRTELWQRVGCMKLCVDIELKCGRDFVT